MAAPFEMELSPEISDCRCTFSEEGASSLESVPSSPELKNIKIQNLKQKLEDIFNCKSFLRSPAKHEDNLGGFSVRSADNDYNAQRNKGMRIYQNRSMASSLPDISKMSRSIQEPVKTSMCDLKLFDIEQTYESSFDGVNSNGLPVLTKGHHVKVLESHFSNFKQRTPETQTGDSVELTFTPDTESEDEYSIQTTLNCISTSRNRLSTSEELPVAITPSDQYVSADSIAHVSIEGLDIVKDKTEGTADFTDKIDGSIVDSEEPTDDKWCPSTIERHFTNELEFSTILTLAYVRVRDLTNSIDKALEFLASIDENEDVHETTALRKKIESLFISRASMALKQSKWRTEFTSHYLKRKKYLSALKARAAQTERAYFQLKKELQALENEPLIKPKRRFFSRIFSCGFVK